MKVRALHEVSHHVDWGKLHDEYVGAVLDSDQSRRRLQKRQKRVRGDRKRKRRDEWDLENIEAQLQAQANAAVADASGTSKKKGKGKGNGTNDMEQDGSEETDEYDAASDGPDNVSGEMEEDGALKVTYEEGDFDGEFVDELRSDPRQQTDDGIVITDDGIAIPPYTYNQGNCPDAGDSTRAVPCAPDNLEAICDKYSGSGSFVSCFEACTPSFCCIHGKCPLLVSLLWLI